MASYKLLDSAITTEELEKIYNEIKLIVQVMFNDDWTDLDLIFNIAKQDLTLFPAIALNGHPTPKDYIEKWMQRYFKAMHNQPSKRIATPKTACTDPAIRIIVQKAQGLNDEEAIQGEKNHNLFMSAENIQGNLLEEYIASQIRDYGFIWCQGETLHAIDFCNDDGSFFLQVKNKSNTENSSSSTIRDNTPIEKWYRLGTRTENGKKLPRYMWDDLNRIINEHKTNKLVLAKCDMSEEKYQSFLKEIALENTNLITDL